MAITVGTIAEWIAAEVVGDPDLPIRDARPLGDAGPGDLTYLDAKTRQLPESCLATAFVVGPNFAADGKTLLRVSDPLLGFAEAVSRFRRPAEVHVAGIDPMARVHPGARVSPEAFIDAFVFVGEDCEIGPKSRLYSGVRLGRGVRIGSEVTLHANVVVGDGCVVGDRVTIHPNAVIGADGFGYRMRDGKHVKVPQQGHVEIGSDVEVGACSTIDRATFGVTRIGEGTKIDNLVMIAHNCQIGRHNLIVAQVGIAGSCKVGDYVVMAGQSGVADHVTIGDGTVLGAQAGVINDIPAGQRVWGIPALPEGQTKRMHVVLTQLTEMWREAKQVLKGKPAA